MVCNLKVREMGKKLMIVMMVFAVLIVFGMTQEVKVEVDRKVFVGITCDCKSDGDCFNGLACCFQGEVPCDGPDFNGFCCDPNPPVPCCL